MRYGEYLLRTVPNVGSSCVTWSPDGQLLAIDGEWGIQLWNTHSWAIVGRLHHPNANKVFFSNDGSSLFTLCPPIVRDDPIRAWSVKDRCQLWASGQLPKDGKICSVDPRGKYISVVNKSHIFFLDAVTGEVVRGKEINIGEFTSNSFSHDGKLLYAAVNTQARLLIIDVDTCKIIQDFTFDKNSILEDDLLTLDEKEKFTPVHEYIGAWSAPAISHISPEEDWIGITNTNTTTYILERSKNGWRLVYRLPGLVPSQGNNDDNEIQKLVWSPDGNLLARAHIAGFISLVEKSKLWKITMILPHEDKKPVNDITFSTNGYLLASIGGDNMAYIWNMKDSEGGSRN
jgi:WD40 repeat protein